MDEETRRQERQAATGDLEAQARVLRSRLRGGTLDHRTLSTLAYLDHAPALLALGETTPRHGLDAEERLLLALARLNAEAWLRACYFVARGSSSPSVRATAESIARRLASKTEDETLGLLASTLGEPGGPLARLAIAVYRGDAPEEEDALWDQTQWLLPTIPVGLPKGPRCPWQEALERTREDLVPWLLGEGDPMLERGRAEIARNP